MLYKIIAGVSFVILCFTQLLHIRNMYNVEARNYKLDEKKKLQTAYEKSIANDIVFPGGGRIMNAYILRHIDTLQKLAAVDSTAFHQHAQKVYDSIFVALRKENNMDSVLQVIKKKSNINTDLDYAVVISSIELAFQLNQYTPFFSSSENVPALSVPMIEGVGAKIGGTLANPTPDNQVSGLIVSTPIEKSYRIRFMLYCDSPDRLKQTILSMLPTILVSVFSILAVLIILLITLINWQKQKKISEAKSDFINIITHEFQTPLSAIIIANRTIENENQFLGNDRLSFLNGVIRRQTERLNLLIKQVAGSNTDQGIALSLVPCQVNELLEEIIADYQVNLQGKNTSIFFNCGAAADDVLLDKPHVVSIIINLLDNAVKYNHKPKKEIHIVTTNPNEKTLTLSVRDNGDGMSEKVRKQIFTRFYRDPSLTRNNEPGLGLGLYFAKQSMDAHHWKCEVKTKEGAGTEFTITLPLTDLRRTAIVNQQTADNPA